MTGSWVTGKTSSQIDSFFGSVNLRVSSGPRIFCPSSAFAAGPEGWTLFRGRLDGRAELASKLGVRNSSETPDAELVRLAIGKWEEAAPQHLLGDFAIAAWRESSRRLILAGDVTGIATVYFWRNGDQLSFATSLRDLLANFEVPTDLNQDYLVDCLSMNRTGDDATVYQSVKRVAAGSCIVLTAEHVHFAAQHRFDPHRHIQLSSDGEYMEAAWDLLRQAVADRTRSANTPVLGSSGLDSACIAAAMAAGGAPFPYLTAVPDPTLPTPSLHPLQKSEQHLVEVMAAALPQMQPRFFEPAVDRNWSPDWQEPLRQGCMPHRSPMQVAWLLGPSQHAATLGATSFLSGMGGNFTLTWDGWRQLPGMLRGGDVGTVARELLLGCDGRARRFAGLSWREVIKPLAGGQYWRRSLARYCGLRPQAVEEFRVLARMRERGTDPEFIGSLESRLFRIEALYRGRSRRPELTNMLEGMHGTLQTAPLLDQRLVDFCLAIPPGQYLRHGVNRWLARRLLVAHGVPAEVAENRRFGYQHPEWFAHLSQVRPAMSAQVAELRNNPTASRLLDLDRLERILRRWPADADTAERDRSELSSVVGATLAIGAFIRWAQSGIRVQQAVR
jgi:asparagine synthase (glutamine-hydrolysing)